MKEIERIGQKREGVKEEKRNGDGKNKKAEKRARKEKKRKEMKGNDIILRIFNDTVTKPDRSLHPNYS